MKSTKAAKIEKRNLILGIVMMLFAVAVSAGTYAYYQTTITGTATGTVVPWACTTQSSSSTFTVNLGNLKPGVANTINLALAVTNFEATFDITLDNPVNIPANLKFYTTGTASNQNNTSTCIKKSSTDTTCTSSNRPLQTTVDATATGSATTTYPIYWNWPIGTTSETPATSGAASIKINLTCKQTAKAPYGG